MSQNVSGTTAASTDDLAHLRQMVKDVEFCMLTTIDEQGEPHSRPMSTNRNVEFDGDLWFFTYGNSHKALEIRRAPKVNASFADPRNQNWVSMTGTAQIVRDRGKMEQLWQPQLKAWFPQGLDTPDIALLKVDVEKAELWDTPSSTLAHAYSLASALVTGKPAQPGDNKKLDLSAVRGTGVSTAGGGYQPSPGGSRKRRGGGSYRSGDGGSTAGLAVIGGAALGAALIYLFDPQRGQNRRAYLGGKAKDLKDSAGRTARDLSGRAQNRLGAMRRGPETINQGELRIGDTGVERRE